MHAADPAPGLPLFSFNVQALELGGDVKGFALELIETESREPVRGPEAAAIWAAVFPVLAAAEPFVLDFFSHIDRVRDFCNIHHVEYREAAARCLVIPQPSLDVLRQLIVR